METVTIPIQRYEGLIKDEQTVDQLLAYIERKRWQWCGISHSELVALCELYGIDSKVNTDSGEVVLK